MRTRRSLLGLFILAGVVGLALIAVRGRPASRRSVPSSAPDPAEAEAPREAQREVTAGEGAADVADFGEGTVWVDPVVNDWRSFSVRFDPDNVWWKRSRRYFELAAEAGGGRFIPVLPDYGDCLTCFSLLRGPERLLYE